MEVLYYYLKSHKSIHNISLLVEVLFTVGIV